MLFLPGSVLPAQPAYAALLDVLGEQVEVVAKDLEVYADEQPPPDYSLGTEIDGIVREAEARGFERFHLAGYSGGGAAALAFAAAHGERLLSLALLEPAWAGNERSPREEALHQQMLTFDPGIGEANRAALLANIESCYGRAAEKASEIVSQIAVLLQSAEMAAWLGRR